MTSSERSSERDGSADGQRVRRPFRRGKSRRGTSRRGKEFAGEVAAEAAVQSVLYAAVTWVPRGIAAIVRAILS